MAGRGTKSTTTRIEVEIERNREESSWTKVCELAEQLKEKSPELACLCEFLIGEAKLENYLDEWSPIEANINKAKATLMEAKNHLDSVANELGVKAGVAMDAHLLLGKLQYACGHYSEGLKHFKEAELHNLSEKKLPLRSLRLVAESYAIKGLCLQKEASATSKFKKAERDEEMNKSFELASDLSLLYMQKLEKEQLSSSSSTGTHSPLPTVQKTLGVVLEQALQQAPLLFMQQGKPDKALERYRATLCAMEAPGLTTIRLKFMCQMAELLLQGMLGQNYKPPIMCATKSSLWKPKHYSSLGQFIPKNEFEETILLLSVAESMAVRNAVLSQSPEFKDIRVSAFQDAAIVYDLLTIATIRWGQVALLQESLERSMKFSFEEPHLWKQHALSLISTNQYNRALIVFKEVIRLQPKNVENYLMSAQLCYEYLNLPDEGIKLSKEGLEQDLDNMYGLLGRCHMYIGLGYHIQAESCLLTKDKEEIRAKALYHFQTAVETEPNDHLCRYYLSLQLALNGKITDAQTNIKIALDLHPEHQSILHLLVLLLTADHQHKLALTFIENALEEYPDSLNLMYLKAHLEMHEDGPEKALCTAKQMLELWKSSYEGQTNSDMPECDRRSETRSTLHMHASEISDRDSTSLRLQNTAAARVEQALSEVASSMSSFNPRPGPQRVWMLQVEIWLFLAELYLTLDQPSDVLLCIQEATQIYPLSHHIMHMKGMYYMHKKEWTEAKVCFQNAVAINPQHVRSLQQLGLVYHYMGLEGLAETTLREAAKIDPKNHWTWYNLGIVLEALSEYQKASSAMITALLEQQTNPVLPFNSVPLCFE